MTRTVDRQRQERGFSGWAGLRRRGKDSLPGGRGRVRSPGQSLLETLMVIVLFSLLLVGAAALFQTNGQAALKGVEVLKAVRLAENLLESQGTASWAELGALVGTPRQESCENWLCVLSVQNLAWTGSAFAPCAQETRYRGITISLHASGSQSEGPYRWSLLRLKPEGS